MKLITDKNKALKEVSKYGLNLAYVSDELKKDEEVVRAALESRLCAIEYADDCFKNNKKFLLEYIKKDGYMIHFIDKNLLKDKDIVSIAVKQFGSLLKDVDESFRRDIFFIKDIVRDCGLALQDVDDYYKTNKELVMLAIEENVFSFDYACYKLRHDKDVLKLFNKKIKDKNLLNDARDKFLKYFDGGSLDKYEDYDVIRYIIEKEEKGIGLVSASEDIKDDEYLVLKAVEINPLALAFASDRLKNDIYIVATAVRNNGLAIMFASDDLKKDDAIIKYATSENEEAINYIN